MVVFAALAESDHDGLTGAVLSGEGWGMDNQSQGQGQGQGQGQDSKTCKGSDNGKESCDKSLASVEVESVVIGMTMT